MSTSGTVKTTVINTDKVITHAIRRCGLAPTSITTESIDIAKDNLYLILLSMANVGINLWLIENKFVGLKENQGTYVLPIGTTNLLNLQIVRPTIAVGTETVASNFITKEFDNSIIVEVFGFNLKSTLAGNVITFEKSDDGLTWETVQQINADDYQLETNYWLKLEPQSQATFFRLIGTLDFEVNNFKLSTASYSIPIFPYSRDDYYSLSNHGIKTGLPTNYYYQKHIDPQVTLWPIPNNGNNYLSTVCQRQIQDIGKLTEEIEVPERWKEGIIWSLAKRLAFELPGVSSERLALIGAEEAAALSDISIGETDETPLRILPNISRYTR